MSIKTASSEKSSIDEAVRELTEILDRTSVKMLIFFASIRFDPEKICAKIQSAFKDATIFGCSSAGEIAGGRMLKDSVVAMAFDEESLSDVKVEVVKNVKRRIDISPAFRSLEKHFGETARQMDPLRYLGIVLIDGMCGLEEKVMDEIGNKTEVLFIGGSAADDFAYRSTYVYADGRAYTNAAVLALLKPAVPFDLFKTQSVREMGPVLTVTKANVDRREIVEFNHKPASIAYAEALKVPENELAARFPRHPLGLIIDGEPYIRSPIQIAGTSVIFQCGSMEGMPLSLLELTTLIDDTKEALAKSTARLGKTSGIIVFNCAHRALELEYKNITHKYGELFANLPVIGFNSYGEQLIGHMNQTATIVAFGQPFRTFNGEG